MTLRRQTYTNLIDRFAGWAIEEENVRLAFIVGSRARKKSPADEWSDLDMVIAAENPEKILYEDGWLQNLGKVKISFIENTAVGGSKERRVLFDSGLDVDFAVFQDKTFREIVRNPEITAVLGRGLRVLLDKDSVLSGLKLPAEFVPENKSPDEKEFLNWVSDFWYHAVWTAKKLRRGEILQAKSCCDNYMKHLLMQMFRWHAAARNGRNYDTWHDSRFFENWAGPDAVKKMRKVYARYSEKEVWKALFHTMNLFREISSETSELLQYPYPEESDAFSSEYTELLFKKK